MSFQICIKTDKSLRQLAVEMHTLLILPPFKEETSADEAYYQFEMLGMLILLQQADDEDRDLEVLHYPYTLQLQTTFTDHSLDTDELEYRLQPYYAQLLSFRLGIETAYHEKRRVGSAWQIRYHFCRQNPHWNSGVLYGEPGWSPAVSELTPSEWRQAHPVF